jgi:hypothetical protein
MTFLNFPRETRYPSMLRPWLLLAGLVLAFAAPALRAADEAPTFKDEELDQMLAPIALYPDALLAQVLMASTYPADVAEAAKWSKANPKQEGDAAVTAVQSKAWDPSVQSLVAFPQVLAMMSEKPDNVQRLGDAFLADPSRVMDRVQFLRKKAQVAGNLNSNEQQKISTQADGGQTTIIIEPAQPEKIYVPVYQPTVVYGPWWYPAYPPYYWAPPPYYYPSGGAFVAGVVWGVAIVGISNSLWGGCGWGYGHGSVNINVNRYNNINVNKLDASRNNVNWNHNADNRKGVPYRDDKTRQQFDRKVAGAENRGDFRGRDTQRDASREQAQAALTDRGIDPAKGREELRDNPQMRDRANQAAQNMDRGQIDRGQSGGGQLDRGRIDSSQARARAQDLDRGQARSTAQSWGGDNAFRGAGNAAQSRDQFNRGSFSRESAGGFGGGGRMSGGGHRR